VEKGFLLIPIGKAWMRERQPRLLTEETVGALSKLLKAGDAIGAGRKPSYYPAFDEFNQSIRGDVRCRSGSS